MTPTRHATSQPAIDPLSCDAIDALMAEPWLRPPDDFAQRVLFALPAACEHEAAPRNRLAACLSATALLAASAAGLGSLLSFIASLWLATSAAG
jgi:hypothetical protein